LGSFFLGRNIMKSRRFTKNGFVFSSPRTPSFGFVFSMPQSGDGPLGFSGPTLRVNRRLRPESQSLRFFEARNSGRATWWHSAAVPQTRFLKPQMNADAHG
jgi:hypothetical protein